VGQGFSNSLTQYDDFAPGSLYDPANLKPMSLTVDSFDAKFLTSGPHEGQPVDFGADITYRETPSASPHRYRLAVNKPLTLDGVSVYLVGHGYAPKLTVRDGNGDVAYSGPVIFLPQDASFASFGVLKVPDAQPQQLGFEGMFFPTYSFTMARGPFSVFPDALRPAISMLGYHGDLGMDTGKPQSVFDLDTSHLAKFERGDGRDFRLDMVPGQRVRLPDGLGSVRFDGWQRWVKLQVSNSPGKGVALTGVVLALIGLSGSLFIRRRRTWVRVTRRDGRSYVEVAGLDRSSLSEGLDDEVRRVALTAAPGAEERLA
jgi:cytochrome c biogenesis protein